MVGKPLLSCSVKFYRYACFSYFVMQYSLSLKYLSTKLILLALIIISVQAVNQYSNAQGPGLGLKLAVYICPPTIPADGGSYKCVYVQIQDLSGYPVVLDESIIVNLSSSNLNVGTIVDELIIPCGSSFAVAEFNTTTHPGETIITASAQGFISGSAVLRTVHPYSAANPPFQLKIVMSPNKIPAEKGFTGFISIQLIDSQGLPLTALSDVVITLTSSNTDVISIPAIAVIKRGSSYCKVKFRVMGSTGSSIITASAQGFQPCNITIRTVEPGSIPSKLMIALNPSILLPDGLSHEVIYVQLLDDHDRPVKADRDIRVHLSSANLDVGLSDDHLVIEAGSYYGCASFTTKFTTGRTAIVALAENLEPDAEHLYIKGLIPMKLAVYSAIPLLIANGELKDVVVVQIQDLNGIPVYAFRDVVVRLSSSIPSVGIVKQTAVIRRGENYIVLPFKSTINSGSTVITAIANGFISGFALINTTLMPAEVRVIAPEVVKLNEEFEVEVYAFSYGAPIGGARVSWSISGGEVIAGSNVTDENGMARLIVRQKMESLKLTITIFKAGYMSIEKTINIRASIPLGKPPTLTIELLGYSLSVFTVIIVVSVITSFLIIAYIYLKYRMAKISMKKSSRSAE